MACIAINKTNKAYGIKTCTDSQVFSNHPVIARTNRKAKMIFNDLFITPD